MEKSTRSSMFILFVTLLLLLLLLLHCQMAINEMFKNYTVCNKEDLLMPSSKRVHLKICSWKFPTSIYVCLSSDLFWVLHQKKQNVIANQFFVYFIWLLRFRFRGIFSSADEKMKRKKETVNAIYFTKILKESLSMIAHCREFKC